MRPLNLQFLSGRLLPLLGLIASMLCGGVEAADTVLPTDEPSLKRYIIRYDDADSMGALAALELISKTGVDEINTRRLKALAVPVGQPIRYVRQMASGSLVVEMKEGAERELTRLAATQSFEGHRIVRVERDLPMQIAALPNDPLLASQWHYAGPGDGSVAGVNALQAWANANGAGAIVAIIDTGYLDHPDVAANVVAQYDFVSSATIANDGNGRDADAHDPGDWANAGQCGSLSQFTASSWHGTHVAGTVAAVTNNGVGVAGVAYGAKLVIARVLGRCGGYTSDIADAIIWSSGGTVPNVPDNPFPAQILNLSLSGQYACSQSNELQNAINAARSRKSTVVVAAGNSNSDARNFSPASCSGVVAVAAVGPTGSRAYYSNFGSVVDIAAPGGDLSYGSSYGVLSTSNAGSTTPGAYSYRYYQGTSMASPHVAGVAALMLGMQPTLLPDAVESGLKASARAFPGSCSGCGAGLVDAVRALAQVVPIIPLSNDVPVNNLSGSVSGSQLFLLQVPANARDLNVTLTAGSGTAQLYLKREQVPSVTSYDCRPSPVGNVQTCSIAGTLNEGRYYLMVYGVTDFSGYQLRASYSMQQNGRLQFSAASYGVGEAAGTALITVNRVEGSYGAVSVNFSTANGSAVAGSDYTTQSGVLNWAAGDGASKTFSVPILNDAVAESSENVVVTLSGATGGATLGSPSSASVVISDDDNNPGTIAFGAETYSVDEGATTVTLTAVRSGGANGVVSAAFSTVNGTAVSPNDFSASSGTVSWANGASGARSISITIANDAVAEAQENFRVTLSNASGGAAIAAPSSATVLINDNDSTPGTLSFSVASSSVSEGAGTAVILVNRTGGSAGAVGVSFSTINDTAIAGSDYLATSGTLRWEDGDVSSKSISVPIVNDSSVEQNESLRLSLSNPSGGASIGAPATSTLTIMDNDSSSILRW